MEYDVEEAFKNIYIAGKKISFPKTFAELRDQFDRDLGLADVTETKASNGIPMIHALIKYKGYEKGWIKMEGTEKLWWKK